MTNRARRPPVAFCFNAPPGDDPIHALRRLALIAILAPALLTAAFAPVHKKAHPKARPAVSAAAPKDVAAFTEPDYAMGDPKASVTVVEYLSNTCSHCAHFDQITWPETKAKYVDTGKVRWVVREFLTPPQALSAAGFVLARCAGKDHYFAVIEQLFKAQEEMAKTNQIKTIYQRIAAANGVTDARYEACMNDDKAFAALYDRVKAAMDGPLKIESTPTFLIGGKKIFEGVPSVGEMDKALRDAGVR